MKNTVVYLWNILNFFNGNSDLINFQSYLHSFILISEKLTYHVYYSSIISKYD